MAALQTKPSKSKTVNLLRKLREVEEAMQEIIERWQPFLENVQVDELFAEKRKQIRKFNDYETTLTDLIEGEFSRDE